MKDVPMTYESFQMSLQIESYRSELWANHVLSKEEQEKVRGSLADWPIWKFFESLLGQILGAFQECNIIDTHFERQRSSPNDFDPAGKMRPNIATTKQEKFE